MKIRFASALLALSLPLLAQDPAAAQAENLFYKAYYLEKGARDFAGAMTLYEQFLAQAPGHKLAVEAAKQQFALLDKTGKTKERDAFRSKYEKLLGSSVPATGDAPTPAADARPARPGAAEGRPAGRPEAGAGGRPDMAGMVAELEKQIEKAKAEGNEEEVRRLTQRLERMRQMGEGRGPGAGGPGAGGAGRMGGMAALMGNRKLSEMSEEELGQLKSGLGMMEGMIERSRERMEPEQAKKLETNFDSLKKSLDAGKLDEAQKALDAMREVMRRGGRRGGGEAGEGGGPGFGGGRGAGRGGEAGGAGGGERPARGGRGGGGGGGR